MIVNHRMACVGLLSKLGIYCISSHNCQHHGGALISSISMQQVHMFSQCQIDLLVDCRDVC